MNIYALALIVSILLVISSLISESRETISGLIFSVCVAVFLWGTFALSEYKQKNEFVCKIPVYTQDKIAFSTFKNKLINCTEKFDSQFKPGDSIYVFKELDTWVYGIKWSGDGYIFKLYKDD